MYTQGLIYWELIGLLKWSQIKCKIPKQCLFDKWLTVSSNWLGLNDVGGKKECLKRRGSFWRYKIDTVVFWMTCTDESFAIRQETCIKKANRAYFDIMLYFNCVWLSFVSVSVSWSWKGHVCEHSSWLVHSFSGRVLEGNSYFSQQWPIHAYTNEFTSLESTSDH